MARSSFLSAGSGPPLAVLVPALVGLVVLGLLIGRAVDDGASAASGQPAASTQIVAGQPSGEVITPSSLTGPPPSATPAGSASPSAEPTATPTAGADGFSAEVAVCRSVKETRCIGPFETLPRGSRSFWFVIRFERSQRGDVLATELEGPGRTVHTPNFTVRGGDGYAWGQVSASSLEPGDYTLNVACGGVLVATAAFNVR